ncbi:unnamed protein product [Blepharisma stoltei]|uniref:Uncharacterized protein n=1 Tax=Blepharisma stoltei TaxID=1481888 RepID=A0AAU9K5K7_9CILI|nr:unnamed protein product [Blepharisma stoltei]
MEEDHISTARFSADPENAITSTKDFPNIPNDSSKLTLEENERSHLKIRKKSSRKIKTHLTRIYQNQHLNPLNCLNKNLLSKNFELSPKRSRKKSPDLLKSEKSRLPKIKKEISPGSMRYLENSIDYSNSVLKRRSESNPKTGRSSSTFDRSTASREQRGNFSPIANMNKFELESYRAQQIAKKLQLPEPDLYNFPRIVRTLSSNKNKAIVFGAPPSNAPVLSNEAPENDFSLNFRRRIKEKIVSDIYCSN